MDGRLVLGWVCSQSAEAAKLQGHNEDTVVAASVTEMGRKWSNQESIMLTLPLYLRKEWSMAREQGEDECQGVGPLVGWCQRRRTGAGDAGGATLRI